MISGVLQEFEIDIEDPECRQSSDGKIRRLPAFISSEAISFRSYNFQSQNAQG